MLTRLTTWYIDHVWPLRRLVRLGTWLEGSSGNWKVNAPVAVVALLVTPGLLLGPNAAWPSAGAWIASVSGPATAPVGFGLAALVGWFLVPLLGAVIAASTIVVALALTFATIASAAWLAYHALEFWLR
jgi:hypothetical protein